MTEKTGVLFYLFVLLYNHSALSFAGGMALPETTSFVKLDLLDGGSFIASTDKIHAGVENETFRLYNWAFHVFHSPTGEHMMWDLGISGVCFLPISL